jgi:hypothetical protein
VTEPGLHLFIASFKSFEALVKENILEWHSIR